MSADTMLRISSRGNEEIWYSEKYLSHQIEMAFRAGISKGVRVEIHLLQPMNNEAVADYSQIFWDKIREEYDKAFEEGHVMRTGSMMDTHLFNFSHEKEK